MDKASRRSGCLAVHSIDHVSLEVPDLEEAKAFYDAFGLDATIEGDRLKLRASGDPHCWAVLTKATRKRLRYVSFGIFEDDEASFSSHLDEIGAKRIPAVDPKLGGIWIEGFDGVPLNIRPAEKCSPNHKSLFLNEISVGPGVAGAMPNSRAPKVRPRRLSHCALFTTDVSGAIAFYEKTLHLRLSDRSEGVAFLHGAHGSDHHLLAFVQSSHAGLHHMSWDVPSIQDVGLGAAQMARAGYTRGWGLGRHVLGANYFQYIRDPWGSYFEYSADIDYVPSDFDWQARTHPPEDSLALWGPLPPEDFATNYEPARAGS